MSGTGFQFTYGVPPSDLSYPEFPGRVGSIPANHRIPSLPMAMMPMMAGSGPPPPLPPQRLPSIPQSMTLPSISRVPSIPTATRPYSMGGMNGVDPVLVPSVGWPAAAFASGWPVPAHVSSSWAGEQPMYGQSVGYVLPAQGWSVGPPLHLYGQSPSTSVADAIDGQAQQQAAAEMELAVSMSSGALHGSGNDRADSHTNSSATSATAAAASSDSKAASAYNVRVSPPPLHASLGSHFAPSSYMYGDHVSSLLPLPSSLSSSAPLPHPSASLDPATFHHNIRCLSESTPRLRCLPTADHSEQVLFVSHAQYAQIVKRRDQRRNDKRRRIKSKHKSRQAHAARRVRGTGGRFLTKEEKAALAMQQQMQMQQQAMQQQAGGGIKSPPTYPFAVPATVSVVPANATGRLVK